MFRTQHCCDFGGVVGCLPEWEQVSRNSSFVLLVQEKTEEEEFATGPLSVLTMSVRNNTQVSSSLVCTL